MESEGVAKESCTGVNGVNGVFYSYACWNFIPLHSDLH